VKKYTKWGIERALFKEGKDEGDTLRNQIQAMNNIIENKIIENQNIENK